jgi:hypothetical protein
MEIADLAFPVFAVTSSPAGWLYAVSGLSALIHLTAQAAIYTGLIRKGDKATNLPSLLRANVVIQ